jgi:hypothetical protein
MRLNPDIACCEFVTQTTDGALQSRSPRFPEMQIAKSQPQ